jgi:hypothetical protein
VASAGDVDGDGLDDILIGAPGFGGAAGDVGKTYLMYGSTVTDGIAMGTSTWNLSQADVSFLGGSTNQGNLSYGPWSGSSVASAGDVNGDGTVDLLVGARYASTESAYILLNPN